MAGLAQTAPQQNKCVSYDVQLQDGQDVHIPVEQVPGGFRLGRIFLVNMWNSYSHMSGKVCPTLEALFDDACPGWQSYSERTERRFAPSASEETAAIKAELRKADITPKSVRHYLRHKIIVELGHKPSEAETEKITAIVRRALNDSERNGIYVVDKLVASKITRRGGRKYPMFI